MTKKIIITVLIALLICFGLYFYFSSNNTNSDQTTLSQKISNFFPTGAVKTFLSSDNTNSNSDSSSTDNNGGVDQNNIELGKIYKLADEPVAGATFVTDGRGTTSVIYVEKTTGHVIQVNPRTKEKIKLSNTTLPGIYDTFWGKDKNGWRVVERYLKDNSIQNYSNLVSEKNTSSSSRGTLLNLSIVDLAVSPNKNLIASLRKNGDSTDIVTSDFDGQSAKTIFSTTHNEWLISWPSVSTITLQTKPAANIESSLYFLNTETGSLKNVLGGLNLSTSISPDTKKVLYSNNNALNLYLYDLINKQTKPITFKTLAEKCVWSTKFSRFYCAVPTKIPTGQYPDEWYSGEKSFNDDLWVTDLSNNTSFNLYDSQASKIGSEMDITALNLNQDESALIFINKRDNTLWYLSLKNYFDDTTVASSTKKTTN